MTNYEELDAEKIVKRRNTKKKDKEREKSVNEEII